MKRKKYWIFNINIYFIQYTTRQLKRRRKKYLTFLHKTWIKTQVCSFKVKFFLPVVCPFCSCQLSFSFLSYYFFFVFILCVGFLFYLANIFQQTIDIFIASAFQHANTYKRVLQEETWKQKKTSTISIQLIYLHFVCINPSIYRS